MEMTDYGNDWIGYGPMGPTLPREMQPKPVASYRALLPGENDSSLTFAQGIDWTELAAALNRLPEYMPFVWPDCEVDTLADLRTLALLKILSIVSIGAGWRSLNPADILTQAMADRPEVVSWTTPWLKAIGEVYPDGHAGAGFGDLPGNASHPPIDIIGGQDDRLMAAIAGADLIRLIQSEHSSWDPFFESPISSKDVG